MSSVIPSRKVLRSKGEERQRDPDLKTEREGERVCKKAKT